MPYPTADDIRSHFPEFISSTTYPDSQIDFWIAIAIKQVRAQVWKDQTNLGIELYVCHNLVLEATAQRNAAAGGLPGVMTGPINNRSVDKVSVGYDTAAVVEDGAGQWNLTIYGSRFWQFCQMFGAGGIQVDVYGQGLYC